MIEDGIQVPVDELVLQRPGTLFVLAVGPGQALAIRDSQGLSRYDHLLKSIEEWTIARAGSTLDDLSFVAPAGQETTHQMKLDSWTATVKSYLPVLQDSLPGFDVLGRAVEIASDPIQRQGMGRIVLFVTAVPERSVSEELQSLAARANQRGVKIFVWLVGSPEQFATPQAAQLGDLAALTGGSLFAFSGQEDIPDLETYLEPLRNVYFLSYTSRIDTSGAHEVSAVIHTDSIEASTPVQPVELEILPPNVNFISPPTIIDRAAAPVENATPVVLPESQSLDVLIEFPDGYYRSMIRSALYVDGILEQENTSEPFDSFQWNLVDYSSSEQHLIRVEAEDSLGLTGASAEIPVIVNVSLPVVRSLPSFSGNRMLFASLFVLLAGSIILLGLIVGGRLRPGTLLDIRRRRRKNGLTVLPEPVRPDHEQIRQSRWMNRLHWPQRQVTLRSYASLIRMSETGKEGTSPPISITSYEVTFGSDPAQAMIVLPDPSVETLHARLLRQDDGSFLLVDEGTTAGTWVNYSPVSEQGLPVEQGDWIHIGRVLFRFVQKDSNRARKVVIQLEGPAA